jgi:hypothetical protein
MNSVEFDVSISNEAVVYIIPEILFSLGQKRGGDHLPVGDFR